jgi:hypothetical protein
VTKEHPCLETSQKCPNSRGVLTGCPHFAGFNFTGSTVSAPKIYFLYDYAHTILFILWTLCAGVWTSFSRTLTRLASSKEFSLAKSENKSGEEESVREKRQVGFYFY